MKKTIFTEKAAPPIGPYSQAVAASGKFIFVSGQIPFTADGKLAGDDIESQARQSLENVKEIVTAAGATLNDVVKCTVLLKDMGDFAKVNEIYAEYFGEGKPARAAYQVCVLPKDVMIEIEAIACLDN